MHHAHWKRSVVQPVWESNFLLSSSTQCSLIAYHLSAITSLAFNFLWKWDLKAVETVCFTTELCMLDSSTGPGPVRTFRKTQLYNVINVYIFFKSKHASVASILDLPLIFNDTFWYSCFQVTHFILKSWPGWARTILSVKLRISKQKCDKMVMKMKN